MKIKIKDIKPNPFRNLNNYPIDNEKVKRLRKSFKHTGFWDNIVARKNGSGLQIAYGHHRLMALRKEFQPNHEVNLIVKPLDDASMIKVMADENDDLYGMSPAVVNETVKAARDFLRSKSPNGTGAPDKEREQKRVSQFLNWEEHKVKDSLAALSDIEGGEIDKDVYESFPTPRQANEFRRMVTKNKVALPKQRQIAKKLTDKKVASRQMKSTIVGEIFKKEKQKPDILEYLYKELRPKVGNLDFRLQAINKNKKHIIKSTEAFLFFESCKRLKVTLESVLRMPKVSTVIKDKQLKLTAGE